MSMLRGVPIAKPILAGEICTFRLADGLVPKSSETPAVEMGSSADVP